ncbi:MAG: response regulator, partial [Pseudomonadota bacterium]
MHGAPPKFGKPVKLLLLEPEHGHALAFCDAFAGLGDRVQLTVAGRLGHALELLSHGRPDMVFAALELPDGKGTDLLVGSSESLPFPVVIMDADGSVEDAVEVMKSGAIDYVVKSS